MTSNMNKLKFGVLASLGLTFGSALTPLVTFADTVSTTEASTSQSTDTSTTGSSDDEDSANQTSKTLTQKPKHLTPSPIVQDEPFNPNTDKDITPSPRSPKVIYKSLDPTQKQMFDQAVKEEKLTTAEQNDLLKALDPQNPSASASDYGWKSKIARKVLKMAARQARKGTSLGYIEIWSHKLSGAMSSGEARAKKTIYNFLRSIGASKGTANRVSKTVVWALY